MEMPVSSSSDIGRREELLDQIEELVLSEGFAHLRVGALAAHLRCSRSTLYKLASSKEELIALVFRRFVDKALAEASAEAALLEDPAERVIRFTEAIGRWQAKGSEAFWRDVRDHPQASDVLSQTRSRGYKILQGYLDEGVASGRFRPANTTFVAYLIWHSYRAARDPDVVRPLGITSDEAVREIGRLIAYGMDAGAASTSAGGAGSL
jgi:AcrR family transcriptional regulator